MWLEAVGESPLLDGVQGHTTPPTHDDQDVGEGAWQAAGGLQVL